MCLLHAVPAINIYRYTNTRFRYQVIFESACGTSVWLLLEQAAIMFVVKQAFPEMIFDWLICTGADVDRVKREIEEVIGIDCSNAILASAKQVSLELFWSQSVSSRLHSST